MDEIIKAAEEELEERLRDYPDEDVHDVIHEIADSHVPVYTADIIDCAADDNSLATDEPELGPAFGGEPTPVNIIAANIYERLTQALHEAAERFEEEDE